MWCISGSSRRGGGEHGGGATCVDVMYDAGGAGTQEQWKFLEQF
jgi:hypothetical protein